MKPRILRLSYWIYGVMLRAYPSGFRREYSHEMMLVFRNLARDVVQDGGTWALVPFWLNILWDWLRTTIRERKDMEPNELRSLNLLTFAIALIPTVAFILHDPVFQLPDNAHEATLGFVLSVVGLLCVWVYGGYFIARRVNGARSALIAGAVAGIVSVGILWLTSIVLNNAFPDRMIYEPEGIRAFHQSGYATMREYLNHGRGWGPAPLLMFVAALVGAIGGSIRSMTQRRRTAWR